MVRAGRRSAVRGVGGDAERQAHRVLQDDEAVAETARRAELLEPDGVPVGVADQVQVHARRAADGLDVQVGRAVRRYERGELRMPRPRGAHRPSGHRRPEGTSQLGVLGRHVDEGMHPPGRQRHDAEHAAARPRAGVVPPAGRTTASGRCRNCRCSNVRSRHAGSGRGRRAGGAAAGSRAGRCVGTLDLPRVPTDELVDVLRAQSRQCAHEQARLWASLVEVGLAVRSDELPDGFRNGGVAWASSEVAAALTWTSRTADRELDLAQVVVRALPKVFAALWAGEIDRGKAVVFAGYLDPLTG